MDRENEIIEADGRNRSGGVAGGVLGADERGEVECCGGDEVGEETEGVDEGEGGGGAGCGAAAEVEDGLRVEGEGPGGCAVGGFWGWFLVLVGGRDLLGIGDWGWGRGGLLCPT